MIGGGRERGVNDKQWFYMKKKNLIVLANTNKRDLKYHLLIMSPLEITTYRTRLIGQFCLSRHLERGTDHWAEFLFLK